MADNQQTTVLTIEDYIRSLSPNANIGENTINGVLIDAGVTEHTPISELTERDKDLSMAYLYIRLATNPVTSQRVTDKDGDWEHTEGSEQWGKLQMREFLLIARDLLAKWGVTDPRIESLSHRWGMRGTGFRYVRRKPGMK